MTPLTSMMKETTKRTGNHCTRAPSNVAHGRIRRARGLEVMKKKSTARTWRQRPRGASHIARRRKKTRQVKYKGLSRVLAKRPLTNPFILGSGLFVRRWTRGNSDLDLLKWWQWRIHVLHVASIFQMFARCLLSCSLCHARIAASALLCRF